MYSAVPGKRDGYSVLCLAMRQGYPNYIFSLYLYLVWRVPIPVRMGQ